MEVLFVFIDILKQSSCNKSMNDDQKNKLLRRIKDLEAQVQEREEDIELYRRELVALNQRIESLLQTAHFEVKNLQKMQKIMVPTELPHLQGFEVSSKFVPSYVKGGDYFDIFEHEDRMRFGVVLSSCEGHATSALVLSLLLKFTGRMEARKGAQPEKIVKALLKELNEQLAEGAQVDLFYALIDRRTFTMSYCRIGAIYAFHSQKEGSQCDLLGPLQSLEDAIKKVEQHQIKLNPKDRLIFCTRGVTEAMSLTSEAFGLERLTKAILKAPKKGAHEMRNEILFRISQHDSGQSPQRDKTLLVLEVKDRLIQLA